MIITSGVRFDRELAIVFSTILLIGLRGAFGCGDFRMPSNHFEGVTSRGYVSIWKQLDTLDLGDASVPILLGAQTYRKIPSGELGPGWIMPLFDSGIVQRDENTFDMITPDGTMDFFLRDRENPSILNGSSGWTGEIQGNDVIVHSKCGSGWKMVFRQGRLDTLSKGSHEFRIQRDPLNRPTGITENGMSRLALNRDEKTGLMSSIEMNGKNYLFGYEGKPRVENVGGQNLVGGVEPSLHQITYPQEMGGKKETYDFAVTEKMQPNLKITDTNGKERVIVWGGDSRMLQDGEWSYKITPGNELSANAAIERTNAQKQKEYWFKDDPNGKETTVAQDGTKTERTWFTSGPTNGKTRKVVQVAGGVRKILEQNTYDEKGMRVRKIDQNGIATFFTYDDRGNRISSSNPILSTKELDRIEQTWKATIELGTEDDLKKQNAIYGLALFYIGRRHDSAKARSLAQLIANQQRRFTVILQSYDHDPTLKPEGKIYNYQKLIQEFPEKYEIINNLINIRKEEI